jgi:hypothetical protein
MFDFGIVPTEWYLFSLGLLCLAPLLILDFKDIIILRYNFIDYVT